MTRAYVVPASLFVSGKMFAAARWEAEQQRLLRRKQKLEAELASIPARIAEAEANIAEHSLEKWRIT